jgi:hypothetical protein
MQADSTMRDPGCARLRRHVDHGRLRRGIGTRLAIRGSRIQGLGIQGLGIHGLGIRDEGFAIRD